MTGTSVSGFIEGAASSEIRIDISSGININGLTGTKEGSGVRLNWSSVSNAIGYYVYTSSYSGGYSNPVNSTLITTTTYFHQNPLSGANYFVVRPVFDRYIIGYPSNEVNVNMSISSDKVIVLQVNNRYMTVNGVSKYVDQDAPTQFLLYNSYILNMELLWARILLL